MLAELDERGYFEANVETSNPVRITKEMYQDFAATDLFQEFNPTRFEETTVMMVHGAEDDVIDPKAAERFSGKFGIPVIWFPGEGHSLSNDVSTPERVIDLAVAFYRGGKE